MKYFITLLFVVALSISGCRCENCGDDECDKECPPVQVDE